MSVPTVKLLDGRTHVLPPKCGNQQGLHCPACGDPGQLCVTTHCLDQLTPDGFLAQSDTELDPGAHAQCDSCGWTGLITDLLFLPIDDMTLEYKNHEEDC